LKDTADRLDISGRINPDRDVFREREARRRRRLWWLAGVVGLPTALLWYRLAAGRPFNVFQLPHITWSSFSYQALTFGPLIFVPLLIIAMVIWYRSTGRSPHITYRPDQLDVTLDDVVGIDVVKGEVVRSLNLFLSQDTFAAEMGGRARHGLLFEGLPGTGKTHTAKAMAREAGVPFLFATATSFQSSFYGATQRKIRTYFKELRKAAVREGGAIAFIDEFDAIAGRRAGLEMRRAPVVAGCTGVLTSEAAAFDTPGSVISALGANDISGPIVNELLVQMQSFDEPTGWQKTRARMLASVNLFLPLSRQLSSPKPRRANLLVIAATNRAEGLDPALLRPGRFDRRLTFELPAKGARRSLVDYFLSRKAHEPELDSAEHRDALAAVTQGYSPVMIEALMDEALIFALRRESSAMGWEDLEQARLSVQIGIGQPVEYTDHERLLIATHESGHAVTAWLTAPERRLEVLSIIKRREALGLLAHGDREDVYTRSRGEMLALIRIAFGGQVSEELFFGDVSTGPAGDLLYATSLAAEMVGSAGMTDSLVSFRAVQAGAFSGTNIAGRVLADPESRAAVSALLSDQKRAVVALLAENRHLVEALRDTLLERHELVGHEITDVLEAARDRRVIDLRGSDALAASPAAHAASPEGYAANPVVSTED
jgi:ATP-dependent Zn protease